MVNAILKSRRWVERDGFRASDTVDCPLPSITPSDGAVIRAVLHSDTVDCPLPAAH